MGKRSPGFTRVERDYYPTIDPRAVAPLIPHIPKACRYVEPCAGDGALIRLLANWGMTCVGACDIAPQGPGITLGNALRIKKRPPRIDCFITNPPWSRNMLHPLIDHLSRLAPTWMLMDADWAYTGAADPYLKRCRKIVATSRLKWIEGTKETAKDNTAWYLFDSVGWGAPQFYGVRPE